MICISNAEKEYLVNHGVWYGEGGISRTYTHNPNYYLCESTKNKAVLRKFYEATGRDPKDLDRRCSIRKGR